ncbi:hypothetical protein X734_23635 [Mesorhizobium sp. L2C084A000]|nr:hypothetical protein X734_23635 [Mesorhizobium sp. L2C084A000]
MFGKTDIARFADSFQARGDIDPIAHKVAIAFLHDVAQVNADPELDAAVIRHPGIALNHGILHFDRAAHCFYNAAELDEAPVASALDDATTMNGDGGVDEVATQRAQPCQDAVFIRAG